jgi:hypothetical protein|tara:strand:- start:3318 stop:3935 length:618 start_codon:yes stop_codon:yes gene_type:complete
LATGFTEWLNASAQGHALLAAGEGYEIYIYVVLGLLAAIANWVTKRKEAAKRDRLTRTVPVQPSKTETTEESTGWLGRLEQLVEAQLGETDQKLERQYDDNYEQESVELPPMIGAGAPVTPPLVGATQEAFRDTPLTKQLREAEQASATRKTTPARSPVYDSPIYTDNMAHRIATDLRAARQAVVGSIILGPPRSSESPEQVTRH